MKVEHVWPAAIYYSLTEESGEWYDKRIADQDEQQIWALWSSHLSEEIESLANTIEEVHSAIGSLEIDNALHFELVRGASRTIQSIRAQKEDYLGALEGEAASLISSMSMRAAREDFVLSFVSDRVIRGALERRLDETYQAFRNRLYAL